MNDVESFIIGYLEEFDEDSLTAIINGYCAQFGSKERAIDRVFDALVSMCRQELIRLGNMHYLPGGGHNFEFLDASPLEVLAKWRRSINWASTKNLWTWGCETDCLPYVILGKTRKWRSATPEEIAGWDRQFDAHSG